MLRVSNLINPIKKHEIENLPYQYTCFWIEFIERADPSNVYTVYALSPGSRDIEKIIVDGYTLLSNEEFKPILFSSHWDFFMSRMVHILKRDDISELPDIKFPELLGWDSETSKLNVINSIIPKRLNIKLTVSDVIDEMVNGKIFWTPAQITVRIHANLAQYAKSSSDETPDVSFSPQIYVTQFFFDELQDLKEWGSLWKEADVITVSSPNCGEIIIIEAIAAYDVAMTCLGYSKMQEYRKKYEEEFKIKVKGGSIIWDD